MRRSIENLSDKEDKPARLRQIKAEVSAILDETLQSERSINKFCESALSSLRYIDNHYLKVVFYYEEKFPSGPHKHLPVEVRVAFDIAETYRGFASLELPKWMTSIDFRFVKEDNLGNLITSLIYEARAVDTVESIQFAEEIETGLRKHCPRR